MATPPTLIAMLFQSRLYVFYDVLILTLAIAIILLPYSVRTQYTDMWRGIRWTTQLLYSHEARLLNIIID